MSRISQILAGSLSEAEHGLLSEIKMSPVDGADFNLQAMTILHDLRLIEFGSGSIIPTISALGDSVLYEICCGLKSA